MFFSLDEQHCFPLPIEMLERLEDWLVATICWIMNSTVHWSDFSNGIKPWNHLETDHIWSLGSIAMPGMR